MNSQIIPNYPLHFSTKFHIISIGIISSIQVQSPTLNGELKLRHERNNWAWKPHLLTHSLVPFHNTRPRSHWRGVKAGWESLLSSMDLPTTQVHLNVPTSHSCYLSPNKMYLENKISIFKKFWDMLHSIFTSQSTRVMYIYISGIRAPGWLSQLALCLSQK